MATPAFRFSRSRLIAAAGLITLGALLVVGERTVLWCSGRGAAPDARVRACTRIIEYSPLFNLPLGRANRNPNFIVRAYTNRGRAYRSDHDYPRALADFDEAVRRDPGYALAFAGRGTVYMATDDLERALADYDRAVHLGLASARRGRGYARYAAGNYSGAANDLSQAVRAEPDNAYAAIWLFLARARSGTLAPDELEHNARSHKPTWPRPVIALFLDHTTPNAVRAAAGDYGERCEAAFYIGSWLALRADATAAASFKTAADSCPDEFIERAAARAELKRVGATRDTLAPAAKKN